MAVASGWRFLLVVANLRRREGTGEVAGGWFWTKEFGLHENNHYD